MINPASRQCFGIVCLLGLSTSVFSQQLSTFNQNASRSNHTRLKNQQGNSDLIIRVNGDGATSLSGNVSDKGMFMPSLSANYYTGDWGIGLETGGFNTSADFDISTYTRGISNFTTNDVHSTEWKNWYVMAGPSFRKSLGGMYSKAPFVFSADLLGGMMKMKPASFSIRDTETGTLIADYYNNTKQSTAFENPLFAIKPSLRLEWFPGGGIVGMNIHFSYLQIFSTKELQTYYRDLSKVNFDGFNQQEIRNQVLNAPVNTAATKGPLNTLSLGGGISIRLSRHVKSPRDVASGMPTGRRDAASGRPTGKRDVASGMATGKRSSRDHASGMATGRRVLPTVNKKEAMDDTGLIQKNSGCGPVTQKTTHPDGSADEMTFSCPNDAAAYNSRISMNVTTSKQTQSNTFGEKVNAGLSSGGSAIANRASTEGVPPRDITARNSISGKITWGTSADGITTNQSPATQRQTPNTSFGTRVSMSAREAGSGLATGRRSRDHASGLATGRRSSRDHASGMATGRRQYQPFFDDNGGITDQSGIVSLQTNPLYSSSSSETIHPLHEGKAVAGNNPLYESSSSGSNPLYQGKASTNNNPLFEESGTSGVNPLSEGIAVNNGAKGVHLQLEDLETGALLATTATEQDGSFYFAQVPDGNYTIKVTGYYLSKKGYDVHAAAKADILGKIETGGDQLQITVSTEKQKDSSQWKAGISTSRSNVRTRKILNTYFEQDDQPGQQQFARPGNPIGGIIVKGGKNPGGLFLVTTTDDDGRFAFFDLSAGNNYTIIIEQNMAIEDEITLDLRSEK